MAFTVSSFGYRSGERKLVRVPVDSSSTDISVGDMLCLATAGYVKKLLTTETIVGFSTQNVTTPSADGLAYVLMDVSELSIYEYPPDTGTVTAALLFKTCDAGGPQAVNIDATVYDGLSIEGVDTDKNTVLVSMRRILAGV